MAHTRHLGCHCSSGCGASGQLAAETPPLPVATIPCQLQLPRWPFLLECLLLGHTLCDPSAAAAVSAFYTGMSILQGNDDLFLDLKQKF